LLSEQQYTATLAREYNLLEPENDLKWQSIHPAQNTFNFLPGDQLVEFARLHNMKVRGHCLVWGHYLPQWLQDGHFTSAQLRALLQEHITKVVGHYKGKIYAWDVVNEAFDENASCGRQSGMTRRVSARPARGLPTSSKHSAGHTKPIRMRCSFTTRQRRKG
jgi:endo-1,4-beta-xylanase